MLVRNVSAILVALSVCASPALAAGGLGCVNEPPDPACTGISSWNALSAGFGGSASLAAVVDTANGNMRVSFAAGGQFPCGATLRFWHNSRDSRTYPCGVGRTHLYNVMLLVHPGEWPEVSVRIVLGNGYRVDFDENLDGTYRGAPGVFSRLYKDPDGSFRLYTNDSPDMVDDGDVLYSFSPVDITGRARLQSITASSGTTRLYYVQSGNGVGEVARVVEDSTGDEATFSYDDQGRLVSVTSVDDVTTSFTYDASGNVSQAESNWGALTFGYDPSHNITSLTDGLGGHSASITYVSSARCGSFRDTSNSITDFSYTTDAHDRVQTATFGPRGASPTVHEITANGLIGSVAAPGQQKMCYTYSADKCLSGQSQCAMVSGIKLACADTGTTVDP